MPQFALSLLGPPRVLCDGADVKLERSKGLALLAYLAVTGEPLRRDELAALLWPELDQAHARGGLRRVLWDLTANVPGPWWAVERETIGLLARSELELDIARFGQLLAEVRAHQHVSIQACTDCCARLAEAVSLYRGDFLAGFTLRGCAAFDAWQLAQTERFRSSLAAALALLAQAHGAQGRFDTAINFALAWLALDPLHEPAHQQLMRLYAWSGQRSAALRQYESCARLLEAELGVSPHESTLQLLRAIRDDQLPGARPSPAARHNLPLQLTNFIGRGQQIAEVQRLLRRARLVTVTGPGGTGKTRLALQVAAEMLDQFPNGAWLVELAPIAEPALVAQAAAQALALPAQTGQSAQQALSGHLRSKALLLILDNCEHLVQACAELAEQLLRTAPALVILATSREALGVAGEISYAVPGLSAPDPHRLPALEVLSQFEAVQLFVERAAAVRPEFALSAENGRAVAQISRRLDGIPLAIELAAVRARALSVEQIAARLEDCFQLLAGGSRTAPPRQQTLRGAIDWSYQLLAEPEGSLLRRLAVFAGGWTLEAAEQVVADQADVLEALTQLVGKSLVLSEQRPGQPARFRMLETIRQFALEKLAEAGEAKAIQDRHLAYFLALAEESRFGLRGHGQVMWLKRLDQDSDNLRAALSWALKTEDAPSALRLAGALFEYWKIRSYEAEGRRWLPAALHLAARHDALARSVWRARALLGAGWCVSYLASYTSDPAALPPELEESLSLYRELDDKAGMALALSFLGALTSVPGSSGGGLALLHQALALWVAVDDKTGLGNCLNALGQAYSDIRDWAKSAEFHQRSLSLLRDQGDRRNQMKSLYALARGAWLDGDGARARALFAENLAGYTELGYMPGTYMNLSNQFGIAAAQGNYAQARVIALAIQKLDWERSMAVAHLCLGQADYLQGGLAEARAHFAASLELFRESNDWEAVRQVSTWLGCVAYRSGDLEQAQALLEKDLAAADPNRNGLDLALALLSRGDVARAQSDPAAAAGYYGRSLKIVVAHRDQPDVAERLEGFAKLAAAGQKPERAARLFGAARALRDRIGTPVPAVGRADYDGAEALALARLSPAAFRVAWAEGQAMDWERAAAYALEA